MKIRMLFISVSIVQGKLKNVFYKQFNSRMNNFIRIFSSKHKDNDWENQDHMTHIQIHKLFGFLNSLDLI